MDDQYATFSESLQTKIVAVLAREPSFMMMYPDSIQPEYFTFKFHNILSRNLMDYYRRYGKMPSRETLASMLSEYCSTFQCPPEVTERTMHLAYAIYEEDLGDASFIREKIVDFGKRQALKSATAGIINLLSSGTGDYNRAVDMVMGALRVGLPRDPGLRWSTVARDIPRLAQTDPLYGAVNRIRTFFPSLDAKLIGHGIGPGEVLVVLGPTGTGKSMMCLNVGFAAVMQCKNVFVYTLELKAIDYILRLASRATGVPIQLILDNPEVYLQRLEGIIRNIGGDCIVKYFTRGLTPLSAIRSHATMMMAEGVVPDMIVIDSLDHIRPSRSPYNTFEGFGENYAEVVALGDDLRCPIVTTSQVGREAYDMPSYGTNKIRGSIEKAEIADLCIAMCQTPEEAEAGKLRIFVDKVRRGKDKFFIPCIANKEIMTIMEDTSPPETAAA